MVVPDTVRGDETISLDCGDLLHKLWKRFLVVNTVCIFRQDGAVISSFGRLLDPNTILQGVVVSRLDADSCRPA